MHSSNVVRGIFLLIIASLAALSLASASDAQSAAPPAREKIRELIKNLASKDPRTADHARDALGELDSRSIESLIELTRTGDPCERLGAALILFDVDPKQSSAVELTNVARSLTNPLSKDELVCRRTATIALSRYVDGIPILTLFLEDRDVFLRQGAVFGFDELTETDEYLQGSKQGIRDAIPVLARARKDQDRTVREMAVEVLDQIANGPDKDLSAAAKKFAPHK